MNLSLRLVLLALLQVGTHARDVRIYHRLWNGIAHPAPQFVLRTIVDDDLNQSKAHEAIAAVLTTNDVDDIYQVAVQSNFEPYSWIVSSTKACFLSTHEQETITLRLTPSNQPYAVDYFVHPTPKNGKCPSGKPAGPKEIAFVNTTIIAVHHALPSQPELRDPVPVTITGEPIKPLPEKSFIQKYWVYILIALAAIVLSGGPPDEDSSRTAQPRSLQR